MTDTESIELVETVPLAPPATTGQTCGMCRHWIEMAKNPLALNEVKGECLERPPTQMGTLLPTGQMQLVVLYLQVPPSFRACHRFEAKPTAK